jgi:hypothetical protein
MEKRIRATKIESVPSHTSVSEPQTYPRAAAALPRPQPTGLLNGWTLVIFLILMFVFFVLPMCSGRSHSNKTDGVFESATEKLDKGLPLNEREQKRIDDILNYDQKKRSEEIERKNGERP